MLTASDVIIVDLAKLVRPAVKDEYSMVIRLQADAKPYVNGMTVHVKSTFSSVDFTHLQKLNDNRRSYRTECDYRVSIEGGCIVASHAPLLNAWTEIGRYEYELSNPACFDYVEWHLKHNCVIPKELKLFTA